MHSPVSLFYRSGKYQLSFRHLHMHSWMYGRANDRVCACVSVRVCVWLLFSVAHRTVYVRCVLWIDVCFVCLPYMCSLCVCVSIVVFHHFFLLSVLLRFDTSDTSTNTMKHTWHHANVYTHNTHSHALVGWLAVECQNKTKHIHLDTQQAHRCCWLTVCIGVYVHICVCARLSLCVSEKHLNVRCALIQYSWLSRASDA